MFPSELKSRGDRGSDLTGMWVRILKYAKGGLMFKGGLTLLVACCVLAGCGVSKRTKTHKYEGVLIQDRQQSIEKLSKVFPTQQVDLINKEQGIFRVRDITLDAVQEALPNTYTENDVSFNALDPSKDKEISIQDLKTTGVLSNLIDDLECQSTPLGPIATISEESEVHDIGYGNVELGHAPLKLTGLNSKGSLQSLGLSDEEETKARSLSANNLQYYWYIDAPEASKNKILSKGVNRIVSFDRLGSYTIILIVQDSLTKDCSAQGITYGVTANAQMQENLVSNNRPNSTSFFQIHSTHTDAAWRFSKGAGVTIAVIDTGVNFNHPDLNRNIKINEVEKNGDPGIDDDGNGFVDDIYGWDFAFQDNSPLDDNSHGTHVSGLAASATFGIAKDAKILPIKALYPSGTTNVSTLISGIYYAIQQNVDIINFSIGGKGNTSPLLLSAIRAAQKKGILIVAAAGNDSLNTDLVPTHLTSRDGSNILSIASVDQSGTLTSYSNYGKDSIDLATLGGTTQKPMMSTSAFLDLGDYIAMKGTSMATPIVAGAAAIIKSLNPNLRAEDIKRILIDSGDASAALVGKITSGKVLDVAHAVDMASYTSYTQFR